MRSEPNSVDTNPAWLSSRPQEASPAAGAGASVLEASHLWKIFHGRKGDVEAVKGVSLSLQRGCVLAFLGPNGAGKTTTIKLIAGLITADAGDVRVAGVDVRTDRRALRQVGAVLEGNRNVYWRLTPEENLEYFGTLRGLRRSEARRRAGELLERFGLTSKRGIAVRTLSRGMQQKLAIAVALVHGPRLLLLDEPTLGLDVEAAEHVKQLIAALAREGGAILLTTHQLEVAQQLADRVAIIHHGVVLADDATPALLKKFTGAAYAVELDGTIDALRRERLRRLGAEVTGHQVSIPGSGDGLYDCLAILRPLPIVRIVKEEATLTDVFMRLIQ
jgi:ABC-2 type transport system ATP-binding protein